METNTMKPSQNQQILHYLSTKDDDGNYRRLTGYTALGLFRVRDLPKRISELSNLGVKFIKRRRKDVHGQRFMEYRLAPGQADGVVTGVFIGWNIATTLWIVVSVFSG